MGYYPRAISGTQGAGQRKMNLAGLLQLGERDPPLIPGGMIPAGVFVIGIFTSIGAVAVGAVGGVQPSERCGQRAVLPFTRAVDTAEHRGLCRYPAAQRRRARATSGGNPRPLGEPATSSPF